MDEALLTIAWALAKGREVNKIEVYQVYKNMLEKVDEN